MRRLASLATTGLGWVVVTAVAMASLSSLPAAQAERRRTIQRVFRSCVMHEV
jgi:hypothetical protein